MDLENLAHIADIAGSVAVVLSLVFVGMQVRQNTRAIRATTYNTIVQNSIAILAPQFMHQEFTEFMAKFQSDPQAATPAETARFHAIMLAAFRHWDNLYYQFRNGMLEGEMWESYHCTMSSWLDRAAWRDWFDAHAKMFSESLQALIRQRIASMPRG